MGAADKILSEIKRGKIYSTYLFLGEDRGSKYEVIDYLKKRLFGEKRFEAGISIFYADEAKAQDIVENLTTFSMFSEKRLVVVHDVDRLRDKKFLIDYIKSPVQDSFLLLLSDKKVIQKSLESTVKKHGRLEIFWPMFQNEAENWIISKLEAFGIRTKPEAVKYILELSGARKDDLNNQIEHIINYMKEGEVLTLETASKIVAQLYRYTVFDLCNQLFVSKPVDIIAIFRYLVTTGEEPVRIEYFLSKALRKILRAYALIETGRTFSQIEAMLGLRKMEARRIGMILKRVPEEKINRLYSFLAELDYTLKSKPKEIGLCEFERLLMEAGY